MIVQNSIAADHVRLIWDLIKGDENLECCIANDRLHNPQISEKEIAGMMAAKKINIFAALLLHWDLIIYVNHPWGLGLWFAPFIRKIYVNHGICTGKINNDFGEDGVYGKSRVLRPFNRPFYDMMFAASRLEKAQAIMETEALRFRIAVTGFLRADLIRALLEKRQAIRSSLGFRENETVVHIISTWGKTSLFQTMGEALLNEAAALSGRYRFIFSLHPRHDEFGDVMGRKRGDVLARWEREGIVPAAGLEWDAYVVASDIAVSDHSSLCLYHILLDRPVILVPVAEGAFRKDSVFDRLRRVAPVCEAPGQLEGLIRTAFDARTRAEYSDLRISMIDYQGLAAERYKEEIYRMIGK